MRSLITRSQGVPTIAPAMKEIPLGISDEIRCFLDKLKSGSIDLMVFLTGVGAESLLAAVETEFERDDFLRRLDGIKVVVRGPKPFAVLRKWGVHVDVRAEEPNTSREVLHSILGVFDNPGAQSKELAGRTIAVQEYGEASTDLYAELERRGATVLPVPVYRWSLPDDTEPVKDAIRGTIRGDFDVILITTAQHIVHLLQVADSLNLRDEWLTAAAKCFIASIGPTASTRIREVGLPVHLEPSHPHMGHLVREGLDGFRSRGGGETS